MDNHRLIGRNNQLPWHLPKDLAYFKQVTMGHAIVMGRKTFESIGKPLPGRKNIVVTRNHEYQPNGVDVAHSIEEICELSQKNEEIFIIGGAEIFKATLPVTDRLYITEIHETFDGDTFFPVFNLSDWELISKEKGIKDEKNPYEYDFCIYEKKSRPTN